MTAVEKLGNSWKAVAKIINDQFQHGRTAENVKDKYKSLGGENAEDRILGNWSLKETIDLIKAV